MAEWDDDNDVTTSKMSDGDTLSLEFVVSETSVPEATGAASTVVWLSDVHDEDITAEIFVTGTATGDDVDYALDTTSITIPAGDIAAEVDLTIVDDSDVEGNESIVLILANLDGAELGANASQSFSILDDDLVTASTTETVTPSTGSTTTTSLGSGSFSMGGYGCSLIR